jgi:hypothetical protein
MASERKKQAPTDDDEYIEIRWRIKKKVHKKIAMYQKSKELLTLDAAGNILLEKITDGIQLIEL